MTPDTRKEISDLFARALGVQEDSEAGRLMQATGTMPDEYLAALGPVFREVTAAVRLSNEANILVFNILENVGPFQKSSDPAIRSTVKAAFAVVKAGINYDLARVQFSNKPIVSREEAEALIRTTAKRFGLEEVSA